MTRFLCHVPYDSVPNLKAGSAPNLSSGARLVLAGSAQLYFHHAEINHFILRDDVQSAAVDGIIIWGSYICWRLGKLQARLSERRESVDTVHSEDGQGSS